MATNGRPAVELPARRVRPGVIALATIVLGLLAFTPAVVAKGANDNWQWRDLAFWTSDDRQELETLPLAACAEPPRATVDVGRDEVVVRGTMAGGLTLDDANARLAGLGIDLTLHVDPTSGLPAGAIAGGGSGGTADGDIRSPRYDGAFGPVTLPRDLGGRHDVRIACDPA